MPPVICSAGTETCHLASIARPTKLPATMPAVAMTKSPQRDATDHGIVEVARPLRERTEQLERSEHDEQKHEDLCRPNHRLAPHHAVAVTRLREQKE